MHDSSYAVTPIDRAWLSLGGTGAPNYDEFNSLDEVTTLINANPGSILAVDMPHGTPRARAAGASFFDALPDARRALDDLKASGRYTAHDDALVAYRIAGSGRVAHGVFALVATSEISDRSDAPGRVVRNEDVFVDKVRERTAHIEALRHVVSPVLLLAADTGERLDEVLRSYVDRAGAPLGFDTDEHGLTHELWLVPPGDDRDEMLSLLNDTALVVADGNHRSLAAQEAGLDRFLAVITTNRAVRIEPYNRLLRILPVPSDNLATALAERGFDVTDTTAEPSVTHPGDPIRVHLGAGRCLELRARDRAGTVVDRIDHAIVERRVLGDLLGLDPGDKAIAYVGGEEGVDLLRSALAEGAADAVITVPPVTVEQFLAVNLDRLKMPRKSTWFTPKARSGLVLVELDGA